MRTKILFGVGTVGLGRDPNKFLLSYTRTFDEIKCKGFDIEVIFPYRKPPYVAQNIIVEAGLKGNTDYIFIMDDDIWDVPSGLFQILYEANKEFISGLMPARDYPFHLCAMIKNNPKESLIELAGKKGNMREQVGPGIKPVDLTAFPFTLWKTSLFGKLKRPYFKYDPIAPTDNIFCQECLDVGIQPYVYMDYELSHDEVTRYNRAYLWQSESIRLFKQDRFPKDNPYYEQIKELVRKTDSIIQ